MELGSNTVGIILKESSKDENGNYHFFVGGREVVKDTNVLYISSTKVLSDDTLKDYIKGTNYVEEIIKLK